MRTKNIKRNSKLTHIKRKLGMDKEMNRKLKRINVIYRERTRTVGDFWDFEDFLMLLNLAEYGRLGKSKAIVYAYKLGYLAGKWGA